MTDTLKDAVEIVRRKRVEIQKLLEKWSEEEGLPAKGIQLNFTLSASSVPPVVQNANTISRLMMCSEFFTCTRFGSVDVDVGAALRIINVLERYTVIDRRGVDFGLVMDMNLDQFLDVCLPEDLLRLPNFGKKSLGMVTELLAYHGLALKNKH